VFILDADEQITPELAEQIGRLDEAALGQHPIVTMPRRNYLLGRYVRAWSPDRQTRLIDRRRVHWPDRAVHDSRVPTEGRPLHLSAPLLHNAQTDDWSDYFDGPRYARRTEAIAREMHRRGRRVGFLGMLLRPWAAFVKFFLLKRGFLDGTHGLLIAQKAAVSTQLKYARLWHLQQQGDTAEDPAPGAEASTKQAEDAPGAGESASDPSEAGFRPKASGPKASESDPDRPGPPAA
jgi:(heptosyl)LPS beta-1,4-glucosyltransferase